MNNQLNINNIANQVAYEGGNGVYTARIMTNFDPEENELPYFAEQDNKIEVEEDKIRVYPNPTSDFLHIEFKDKVTYSSIKIIIFDFKDATTEP
jgi:hypothetical protein